MFFKRFSPVFLLTIAQAAMFSVASFAAPAVTPVALITTDATPLRAAPRDSAQQQAVLWLGEVVEVRGERLDYVQVWDHKRERGGFVRASQLRHITGQAVDAPELLAQVRLVQGTPAAEALGIGLAAAYLEAASAQSLQGLDGLQVFDALGTMADRLAHRASSGQTVSKSAETSLAAHLEVASRYGLKFNSYERDRRMQICYDGEMFRRVLGMAPALARQAGEPSTRLIAQMQARAALSLTRLECVDPNLRAAARLSLDEWQVQVLDTVDLQPLPQYLKNRIHMRRAALLSGLVYQQARKTDTSQHNTQHNLAETALRAISELASVNKSELPDDDQATYNDAAIRVNASRWAAIPAARAARPSNQPSIVTEPGQPGETCVLLVDEKNDVSKPLARRCTFSLVWLASATSNREGTAMTLAVQPMQAWRELWVFHKTGQAWRVDVLPPATFQPELGYAEFAGWVPGGTQMLVAREARGTPEEGGRYRRNYEVTRLADMSTERQSSDPTALGPFQRWPDPMWKKWSVSVR
jgi:hypothetical protein